MKSKTSNMLYADSICDCGMVDCLGCADKVIHNQARRIRWQTGATPATARVIAALIYGAHK